MLSWGKHPMPMKFGDANIHVSRGNMVEYGLVLLAEDEADYVLLIRQAFAEAHIPNPLHVACTGQEVLAYLKGEGKYSDRDEFPLPDLLLLDLKLPGYSGFEILAWIRSQPGLCGMRVLVLTSSDQMKDINDAYRLGANSFLVKPYDFQNLVCFSRLVQEFWLNASKCPESFRSPRKATGHEELPSDTKASEQRP